MQPGGSQGDRPDHRADHLLAAQGRHGAHLPADPAQARLGARRTPGGGDDLRQQAADRRQRPLLTRRSSRRAPTSRWCATPTTGASKPTIDEILFEMYQNADTMVADLKSGALDAAWGIPEAQFESLVDAGRHPARRLQLLQLGLPQPQLLRQAELAGQPGAARRALPQRSELRHRPRQRSAGSPTRAWPRRRRRSCRPTPGSTPTTTGSRRPTRLYTFDLAKASQLLDAAGYPRGERSCASTSRASRSRCGCGPRPTSREAQIEAKLIAGWFEKLGLKIKLSVLDRGALESRIWNFKGNDLRPRLRHVRRRLGGLLRPRPDTHVRDHGPDRLHQRTLLVERRSSTS